MHTPSYVPATNGHPSRIYYTGRASLKQYGAQSRYAIGMLEHIGEEWVRRSEPLIQGVAPRLSVLEPLVVQDDGRYIMWFQANQHEVGPGELPDYELQVSESTDGIVWGRPRGFATSEEGFFDNAVTRTPDGWLMVLARGADIHGTGGFPPQGLWVSTAPQLTAPAGPSRDMSCGRTIPAHPSPLPAACTAQMRLLADRQVDRDLLQHAEEAIELCRLINGSLDIAGLHERSNDVTRALNDVLDADSNRVGPFHAHRS